MFELMVFIGLVFGLGLAILAAWIVLLSTYVLFRFLGFAVKAKSGLEKRDTPDDPCCPGAGEQHPLRHRRTEHCYPVFIFDPPSTA